MNMTWVMIFLTIATLFAIAVLVYVAVDILVDLFRKKKKEPAPVIVPIVAPVEEKKEDVAPVVIPVVIPNIVDHIDAIEADEMMSDDLAMSATQKEKGAGEGKRTYINLGVIDKHFNAGDTVTLKILKEKKLIPAKIKRIKILADGILTKALTVKAESYSIQAIKMIELTGGTVVILEPEEVPNKNQNNQNNRKK